MDSTVSLGLSRRIAAIVSAAVARRNGLRPVSISEMTIPTAKMSDRVSVASPRTCSGDMYGVVPTTVPASVSRLCVFASLFRA